MAAHDGHITSPIPELISVGPGAIWSWVHGAVPECSPLPFPSHALMLGYASHPPNCYSPNVTLEHHH